MDEIIAMAKLPAGVMGFGVGQENPSGDGILVTSLTLGYQQSRGLSR